jgi:uncharacterized RDD family membrane protein YckC
MRVKARSSATVAFDTAWRGAPASWRERFAAFLLDSVLVVSALSLVLAPTGITHVQGWELLAAAIAMLTLPVYFAFSEGIMGGMTIGKRLLGVAVRNEEPLTPIAFSDAILRELPRLAFPILLFAQALWISDPVALARLAPAHRRSSVAALGQAETDAARQARPYRCDPRPRWQQVLARFGRCTGGGRPKEASAR